MKVRNKKDRSGVCGQPLLPQAPSLILGKRWMEMRWLIAAGGVVVFLLLFGIYCCIVVGAREDRLLEELERKGRQDADRENG